LLGRDAAAVDPLQGLDLAGFQANGIAVYFLDRSPRKKEIIILHVTDYEEGVNEGGIFCKVGNNVPNFTLRVYCPLFSRIG